MVTYRRGTTGEGKEEEFKARLVYIVRPCFKQQKKVNWGLGAGTIESH